MTSTPLPVIKPWNRGTASMPNFWATYTYRGERYRAPTGARTKLEFESYKARVHSSMRSGTWVPPKDEFADHQGSFAKFAKVVNDRREAIGVVTAKSHEWGHLQNHLIPEFGLSTLSELDYKRIRVGIKKIWDKGLSPSTVHNVYLTFRTVMRLAVKEGLIAVEPVRLSVKDGDLPALVDAKPEGWRDEAVFEIEEIATLLADARIEPQWRVMYAVYFLTGSRFSEVTRLRVRDYNAKKKPLGQLTVLSGKARRGRKERYRTPPVHPILAEWLAYWLEEGFELHHGRKPEKDDLLFPTLSEERRALGLKEVSHSELVSARWKKKHLPQNGLRHRRLHDARRTLLSLIRSSDASAEIARAITHSVIADKVLDAYTTFHWRAICAAIMAVEWALPKPPRGPKAGGDVISLASRRVG